MASKCLVAVPLILGIVFSLLASTNGLACEDSGYCSIGKLEPYFGDINSGEGLRAALKARSYKNETIIMISTASQLLPFIQTILQLRGLGIEHVLIMSTNEDQCKQIVAHMPDYGCAWDSFVLPAPSSVNSNVFLWHTRWRTLGRSIKIGYNVMCSDTDVLFFDDPYKYFKSPPFNEATIINQPETLWNEEHYKGAEHPNGGVIYVQNASPTGPAAWLIAEVSHRILRFIDTDWAASGKGGGRKYCCYLDQDCLRDILHSARSGVLTFHDNYINCVDPKWIEENKEVYEERKKALIALVQNTVRSSNLEVPKWMQPVAGEKIVMGRNFAMKLPHMGLKWNDTLGPNAYGEMGPLSKYFMTQLKRDCQPDENGPDCPMWPNPEDPNAYEASQQIPYELYLFAPPFLMFGFYPRGRKGFWYKEAFDDGPAQQVIGHLHYNPAGQMALVSKLVARMAVGMYDWQAAHEMHASEVYRMQIKPSRSSQPASPPPHRPNSDERVPKLLALHPQVNLALLTSPKEYQEILIGLAQVAKVTGRTVVYPDVPCDLKWVSQHDGPTKPEYPPLDIKGEWFAHFRKEELCTVQDGDKDKRKHFLCMWAFLSFDDCFNDHKGMMTMELEHIYKHYAHQLPLRPSRTNTFLDVEGPLPEVASAANPASRIFVVPRSQIESSASAYNKMRILYIGQAVQVKEEGGLVELHSGCPGLSREHVKRAYQGAPSNNEIKRIEANVLPNGTLQITNNVLDKLPSDRKRRALREGEGRSLGKGVGLVDGMGTADGQPVDDITFLLQAIERRGW